MIIIGYIRLNENPHGILVDDCVIRAISTAIGQNWDDVYVDLMLEGLEHKDYPNKNVIWWNYLQRKGYKRFIIPDTCPMCYTLKDFVEDHHHGIYIVGDGSHVVAVVDGYYIDTYDSGNMIYRNEPMWDRRYSGNSYHGQYTIATGDGRDGYSGRNMRQSYSRGNDTRMELEEMLNNTRDPQEAETLRKIINRL